MYFSSNRDGSFGGFDIYKSEGRLNIWSEPKNVKELNSPQDDLYLTFYNEKRGYFSSNREGQNFKIQNIVATIYSLLSTHLKKKLIHLPQKLALKTFCL